MYKILFVDDEQSVLEYLPLAIQWDELDITEMHTASDAQSALKIVKEIIPDIIIADVEMPGMSGLEFCKEVKRTNPDIELVILSAFDRFDYAKKAIGMGVEDYLLKPVDEEELWQLMKRIVDGIEASGKKKSHSHLLELQALEKETGTILRNLFSGTVVEARLNDRFSFLDNYENFWLIMQKNDGSEELRECLKNILAEEGLLIEDDIFIMPEQGFYILLGRKNFQISMEQKTEDLERRLERQGNSVMISYVGIRRNESYEDALRQCFFKLEEGFFDEKEVVLDQTDILPPDLKEGLNLLSEEGNISDLKKVISETVICAKQKNAEPVKVCNMLMDVLITLKTYLARYWQDEAMEVFRRITVFALFRCGSLDGMYQMIERCMGEFQYFVINQQKTHGNSYIVRIAKEYTKEHYQDTDLSLQNVADATGTSRTYFSKIFKELTKEKYWDYLSKYRIEKAKILLNNTNLSQAEISVRVGYASEFHFSRKFKEIVGVSPNKFRKS